MAKCKLPRCADAGVRAGFAEHARTPRRRPGGGLSPGAAGGVRVADARGGAGQDLNGVPGSRRVGGPAPDAPGGA